MSTRNHNFDPSRQGAINKSEYELACRLLVQDRGASEAEDARAVPAPAPMPILTDEQCLAMDEMGSIE